MSHVVGLDLSLRCSGVVRVPVSWRGDWRKVEWSLIRPATPSSTAEAERIARCAEVAGQVVNIACRTDSVLIERYAYRQAEGSHYLGELGGIVRHTLLVAGVAYLGAVTPSQTRRLLCGSGAAGKEGVQAALAVAGAPGEILESPDLCDAMAVANWGLKQLGGAWLGVAG